MHGAKLCADPDDVSVVRDASWIQIHVLAMSTMLYFFGHEFFQIKIRPQISSH